MNYRLNLGMKKGRDREKRSLKFVDK